MDIIFFRHESFKSNHDRSRSDSLILPIYWVDIHMNNYNDDDARFDVSVLHSCIAGSSRCGVMKSFCKFIKLVIIIMHDDKYFRNKKKHIVHQSHDEQRKNIIIQPELIH
jgi:hypothetical protein